MRRVPDSFLAALALCVLACGAPPSKSPDPYNGVIDPSALDPKFLVESTDKTVCGTATGQTPCYAPQVAYAGGNRVFFYSLGTVATAKDATGKLLSPPTFAASKVSTVSYDFPAGSCNPAATDPLTALYAKDQQYSIFTALPLASSSTSVIVTPIVAVETVSGVSGITCNDLKTAESVQGGKFGATPSDIVNWSVRAPIDWVNVAPLFPGSTFAPKLGWYEGLLLTWLDGGPIPVDAKGNFVAMDAVAVTYPPTGTATTSTTIFVLPAAPGAPGYSPIVRLHSFTAPSGSSPGNSTTPPTFTALCAHAPPCAANEVNPSSAAATAANTAFIVGSAQ